MYWINGWVCTGWLVECTGYMVGCVLVRWLNVLDKWLNVLNELLCMYWMDGCASTVCMVVLVLVGWLCICWINCCVCTGWMMECTGWIIECTGWMIDCSGWMVESFNHSTGMYWMDGRMEECASAGLNVGCCGGGDGMLMVGNRRVRMEVWRSGLFCGIVSGGGGLGATQPGLCVQKNPTLPRPSLEGAWE